MLQPTKRSVPAKGQKNIISLQTDTSHKLLKQFSASFFPRLARSDCLYGFVSILLVARQLGHRSTD